MMRYETSCDTNIHILEVTSSDRWTICASHPLVISWPSQEVRICNFFFSCFARKISLDLRFGALAWNRSMYLIIIWDRPKSGDSPLTDNAWTIGNATHFLYLLGYLLTIPCLQTAGCLIERWLEYHNGALILCMFHVSLWWKSRMYSIWLCHWLLLHTTTLYTVSFVHYMFYHSLKVWHCPALSSEAV